MTDAEDDLTHSIARAIDDYWDPAAPAAERLDKVAAAIVRLLPGLLYQSGWMPPEVSERIALGVHGWMERTGKLPQDPGPGVLNSYLSELAAILHGK